MFDIRGPGQSGFERLRYLILLSVLVLSFPTLTANPFMSGGGEAAEDIKPARSGSAGTSEALTEIQFGFREKAAGYLQAIKTEPDLRLFLALGAASFLYGLFHGAGPGHRKTIVFSLFLGRKSRWWEPLGAGFLAAGIHAGVSLVLILVFNFVIRGVSLINNTSRASLWLEGGTYLLLAVISVVLLVIQIVRGGHRHHLHRKEGGGIYPVIIASSLLPCPGATMLLLFAISLGLPGPGIFGLIFMSVGMGLVISAAGYLAYAGRAGLFSRLKENERWFARISGFLENGAYVFIFIFSLYMAWPFLISVLEQAI